MAGGNNILIPAVLLLCLSLCLRSAMGAVLYDYGEKVGDLRVPRGRDVAQQVEFPVNFLRMAFETLYISTKGAILFDTPAEPGSRMIAPFFADIDNSKKGSIWYRTTPSEDDLARAAEDAERYFPSRQFKPTDMLIVTWERVCIQRNRGLSKGITFQAVIITDHHYTFVAYLYEDNVFPRARAIPVSPVIGFSTSNLEFFDYAVAEDTKTVFEKTKSSNVNERGVWAFQVDGIDRYDIVWGIPEGGHIQGDENVLSDLDTDLNINLDAVGDDCSACSASASCVDYTSGSCCVCSVGYMGNGKTCLRNETNRPYRANGAISGTLNGEQLSGINVHAFIVASEGRTYTAISPTPEGLNYTLQLLLPVAETIGWLFAVPKNRGMNGITLTGGVFESTSRMRFSTGEQFTVVQNYMTTAENIRIDISVEGTLPVLEDKELRVEEHTETFTRHRPGVVHSFETRTVSTATSEIRFTVEQTIEYDDCLADEAEFDPMLNSMVLTTSSINAFHEAEYPNVRYSMRSAIGPILELVADPCRSNDCHVFASCFPDAESYRCECIRGYTGDGNYCEEEVFDPCLQKTCDENAVCTSLHSSYLYNCTCNEGYHGDGFLCKEEVFDPCVSNRCSRNALCTPDGTSYRCECRSGYEGNGYTCFEVFVDPCEGNRCSVNAECYPDGDRYVCKCRSGYEGDGYTCNAVVVNPCASNRCSRNAECIPEGSSFRCQCRAGYEGNGYTCFEVVLDPCEGNRCSDNAECLPDGDDAYRCRCRPGYEGDGYTCDEIVANPCENSRCSLNADCFPQRDDAYRCRCRSGYEGDGFTCNEVIANPCENNRCSLDAECFPQSDDAYRCRCRSGYEGDGFTCNGVIADPCENNRCSLDAECFPQSDDAYRCRCRSGYEGDGFTCNEIVIDPCVNNRCSLNADCLPEGGDAYGCRCRSGYQGDGFTCNAIPRGPCERNRCAESALCIPEGRSYYCQCPPGFEGDGLECTEVVDDPCVENRCDADADCIPQGSSYACQCRVGFEGDGFICERVFVNPCQGNDCNPLARCIPQDSTYGCECLAGYQGDGYTCVAYPCTNNNCDISADCFETDDGRNFECICKEGYRGDGSSCEAIPADVCASNECDEDGECLPLGDSYDCQCREGFLGNGYYCIAEDPCFENTCDVNAECLPVGDGYRCRCRNGYQGDGYTCQGKQERHAIVSTPDVKTYKCERDAFQHECEVIGFTDSHRLGYHEQCIVLDCSSCDANARCIREGAGFSCECNTGFEGNGQICEDIDECYAASSPCDPNAYCDNTFGNYVCSCGEGFVGDGTTCQVAVRPSGDGKLLYGQGMAVMGMPLADGDKGSRIIHKKRQTIVGVAYDCVDELIYFTDVSKGSIGRVRPDGTEYKKLVKKGLSSPEGIAVDHISRNLYWTDSGFDRIEVANLDGRNRRIIIKTDLVDPRAIVADPGAGYLYWTDWNRDDPKIERSLMDGSERQVLVKEGLQLPNGLTLDWISQKICWADAGSEKVECINLNGDPLTRVTVFSQAKYPFGLAAFDQNLYWTDWTSNSIFSVNKNGALTADEMTPPEGGMGRLYGIIAVQECPRGSNACAYDNGGCSSLCLPLPRGEKSCVCPTDTSGNEIPC